MPGRHRGDAPGPDVPRRRSGWTLGIVVGLVSVLAVLGVVGLVAFPRSAGVTPRTSPAPSASAAAATPHTASSGAPSAPRIAPLPNGPEGPAHAAPPAAGAAPPVHLQVPSIGVDSDLEPLGLLPDKTLKSPSLFERAGWYAGGVRPGDPGPAVIAGHVDSVSGPAVFFRLRTIAVGASVAVKQSNGATVHFVVDSVREYPKNKFPTEAVYGPTPLPELRLITCTGDFDYAARSYLDNLVASAHRVA